MPTVFSELQQIVLVLSAPAKLNLYLHITGKRSDGYHLLDTVFQLIDLQDTVKLEVRQDRHIVLHTPIDGLPDTQHLAVRAAQLLQQHTACKLGADIWVEKRIPNGAGLGGGSSDAATTLMGLDRLWECGLSSQTLQALGLQLGADVPFFCSRFGTAHALGIGEQLTLLKTVSKAYILVYPNCHVSTPAVFKHPDLHWSAHRLLGLSTYQQHNDSFGAGLKNDLQTPAERIAPAIGKAIDWLAHSPHCEGVRMSGSGSAVFAQFENDVLARYAHTELSAHLPDSKWQIYLAKTHDKHPSLDFFTNSV